MAFGHCEYAEERSGEDAGLQGYSYAVQLQRSAAAQIATVRAGLRRALGQQRPILNVRRIILRCAQQIAEQRMSDATSLPVQSSTTGSSAISIGRIRKKWAVRTTVSRERP